MSYLVQQKKSFVPVPSTQLKTLVLIEDYERFLVNSLKDGVNPMVVYKHNVTSLFATLHSQKRLITLRT